MGSIALDGQVDLNNPGRINLRSDDSTTVRLVPRTQTVTWDQMAKPQVEPDTLYIFNADDEILIPQGTPGGMMAAAGTVDTPWTGTAMTKVAGVNRSGGQVNKRANGAIWIPNDGIMDVTQFHVEGTWTGLDDWSAFPDAQNLWGWGYANSITSTMVLSVNNPPTPKVTFTLTHNQNPIGPTSSVYTVSSPTITLGQYPAGSRVRVAVSLTLAGVLTLYINGTQVAQITGVIPARYMGTTLSSSSTGQGLVLGGQATLAAERCSIFDLKISRTPRQPGVPVTVTDANTLTVNPASTTGTTINKKLLGTLKHFKGLAGAEAANGSPSNPVVKVIRTELLTATPIKAGAPDATHPTLGQSGLYSYNWTWVDRTLHHIVVDQGCEPYITLPSTPQILGGTVAPYSNVAVATNGAQAPDLTGVLNLRATPTGAPTVSYIYEPSAGNMYRYSGGGGPTRANVTLVWGTPGHVIPDNTVVQIGPQDTSAQSPSKSVPSDFTAFAHMCADLLYHVIVETGVSVPYASVWNEPDGSTFWAGTEDQYISLYQATANAIRAVVPSVKIGGLELGNWSAHSAWGQDLINACATSGTPLDFISMHPYGGDVGIVSQVYAEVHRWATAAGMVKIPDIAFTEYDYSANVGGAHAIPVEYCRSNDWQAAHLGRMLVEMQFFNALRLVFLDNASLWDNIDNGGLFTKAGVPFAPWNVMKLWDMMAPNVITSTFSGDPGVGAVASTDGAGKTTVFLANLHFRKWNVPALVPQTTPPQTVTVTLSGVSDSTPLTCWMIDDERSNQFDAGVVNAALQTIPVPALQGGTTHIPMKARSVALLQVGP